MTNRDRVLSFLRNNPGHTQQEISRSLGITPQQQVNQILHALMRQGFVYRNEEGRPYKYYPMSAGVQTSTESRRAKSEEEDILKSITRENTLIVVSCTKRKIWSKNPKEKGIYKQAKYAYIGKDDWFQKWRVELEQKWGKSPWLILSAKYGFIEPEHPIHNYDVTFSKLDTGPLSIESLKNQVLHQPRLLGKNERKLCDFKYVLVKENKGETYLKKCKQAFPLTARVLKLTDALWTEIVEKIREEHDQQGTQHRS